jgi:hypothetical protein
LEQRNIDEARQKFHSLLSRYRSEKEMIKEKARLQLIEGLRKEGISGSAVEPELEGRELWEKENGKLDRSYQARLEDIKKELRSL